MKGENIKMPRTSFVLDCSVTMAFAFEDERSIYAENVFNSFDHSIAQVPRIWPLEVSNVLLMNEKKSRITYQQALGFKQDLKKFPITIDNSEEDFYELAREFKLTTYDASYLELALRKKIPIATLDKELRRAAKSCGIDFYLG